MKETRREGLAVLAAGVSKVQPAGNGKLEPQGKGVNCIHRSSLGNKSGVNCKFFILWNIRI